MSGGPHLGGNSRTVLNNGETRADAGLPTRTAHRPAESQPISLRSLTSSLRYCTSRSCRQWRAATFDELRAMNGSVRSSKAYRGSKRRIRRIRLRGNGSAGMWLVLGVVVIALFGLMPWLMRHPL